MDGLDIGAILTGLKDSGEDSPFKDFELTEEQIKALNEAATAEQKKLLEAELTKTEEQRKKEESDRKAEEGRKKKEEEDKKAQDAEIKKMQDKADFGALLNTKNAELAEKDAAYTELAGKAEAYENELKVYREAAEKDNQATLEELKKHLDDEQYAAIEKSIDGMDTTSTKSTLATYKALIKPKEGFEKQVPGKTAPKGDGSIADMIKKHKQAQAQK